MTDLTKAQIQSEAIQNGLEQLSKLYFGSNIFYFLSLEAWSSDVWQIEFYIEDRQNNLDGSREDELFFARMQQLCEVFHCKLRIDGFESNEDAIPWFKGCQKFMFYSTDNTFIRN